MAKRTKKEIEKASIGINFSPMNVKGDEMFKRYNNAWGTIAFNIRRSSLENKSIQFGDKELFSFGIYFLIGNIEGVEKIYVGKADNVLERLRQHVFSPTNSERGYYYEVWDRAIAITSTNDSWGATQIKALEAIMIQEVPDENSLNSKNESIGDNIDRYDEEVRQIELYLANCSVRAFNDVDGAEEIESTYVPNNNSIVEDLQNGMARIPEIVTPHKVVKAMVDMLPADVWNDKTVFLDPACKGGEYLREIYDRLMNSEYMQAKYKSMIARSNHILSEQLYGIALSTVSKERTTNTLDGFGMNIRVIPNYIEILKAKFVGNVSEADKREYIMNILNKEFGKTMNIDVVIGNPPYQEDDGGDATSASALYHRFIEESINISNNLISLIVPSRWMSDLPRGINRQWLEEFRQRKDFVYLVDYRDSKEAFVGVSIAGGVCYFNIKKGYNGVTHRVYKSNNTTDEWDAPLCISGDIIIRDKLKAEIAQRFKCSQTLDNYMSSKTPFQKERGTQVPFDTSWIMFSDTQDEENTIKYFTKQAILGYGYISVDTIEKGAEMVPLPKILLQTSAPIDENVLNKPIYAGVNSTCASSWLVLCDKNILGTEEKCLNCIKYIKSKTLRFLVSCVKSTQHATKEVYKLVPVQDFSSTSDIDWSQPISYIDKQLYKKYNLSDEEIAYIEKTIKPME